MKSQDHRRASKLVAELISNAPSTKNLAKLLRQEKETVSRKLSKSSEQYFSENELQIISDKFKLAPNYFKK
jgi:uncharacterized protein (UPF0216 family)